MRQQEVSSTISLNGFAKLVQRCTVFSEFCYIILNIPKGTVISTNFIIEFTHLFNWHNRFEHQVLSIIYYSFSYHTFGAIYTNAFSHTIFSTIHKVTDQFTVFPNNKIIQVTIYCLMSLPYCQVIHYLTDRPPNLCLDRRVHLLLLNCQLNKLLQDL